MAGISPFSIGNTSSFRVHFPASYSMLVYRSVCQTFPGGFFHLPMLFLEKEAKTTWHILGDRLIPLALIP